MTAASQIVSDEKAYAGLADLGAAPLWQHYGGLFLSEPRSRAVPHLWSYEKLRPYAMHFAESLPIEEAQRRVLMLVNPALQNPPATVQTMFAGIQILLPGEHAPAHRHTANAFRFVIEGRDVYTTVNGERVHMHPGDLLLTAGWDWHDHFHQGTEPMMWLDGLDFPLVNLLECGFFEPYPDGMQEPTVADDLSTRQLIHGRLNPMWMSRATGGGIGNYPWTEAQRAFESVADDAEGSHYDGVVFEYTNPWTAGPVLPTMSCRIQRLRPRFMGRPRRHTPNIICHVVRGSGMTIVDDVELRWAEHDVFAIPGWREYRHLNSSASHDAVLFSFTDEPTLRSLGMYRERAT